MEKLFTSLAVFVILVAAVGATAQTEKAQRFSPKGLKASLSSGSFNTISERQLNEGEGGMVSLGYGFTNRFSLWLSLLGSDFQTTDARAVDIQFAGLELNLQHKFTWDKRLQPYGKVGFGVYSLEEKNSTESLIGTGINVALGVDYFFSKHFGVGAEFMVKKLDYSKRERKTADGDLVNDLNPNLNGDTSALMLTFTIQ